MTGWTLEEWDEVYQRRKSEAARKGRFVTNRPLTQEKVQEMMIMYGFNAWDFYAAIVPMRKIKLFDLDYEPPMCSQTGRVAEQEIRWFLRPDSIPA